jgi:hypothetical protein
MKTKGNLYEAIKQYEDSVDYWNLQVDYHEGYWMQGDSEACFTNGTKEDLLSGEGDTFSGYVRFVEELEDYTAVMIDMQCGRGYETMFFLNAMKIEEEEE